MQRRSGQLIVKQLRMKDKEQRHPWIYRKPASCPKLFLEYIENKAKLKESPPEFIPPTSGQVGSDSSIGEYDSDVDLESESEYVDSNMSSDGTYDDSEDVSTDQGLSEDGSVISSEISEEGFIRDTQPVHTSGVHYDQPTTHQKSTLRINNTTTTDTSTPSTPPTPPVDKNLLKQEYLARIEQYRQYLPPTNDVPMLTYISPFEEVERVHYMVDRRFKIESNMKQYRHMLVGGFMLVQMVLERVKLSTPTFTEQQVQMMPSYNDLLFELACKRYEEERVSKSSWSVEIKLVYALGFNTFIIILGAWLCKRSGFDITSILKGVMGMGAATSIPTPTPTTQRPPENTSPKPTFVPPTTVFDEDE